MSSKTMTVAGIMSGTSADGIDVAIVRIAAGKLRPGSRSLRTTVSLFQRHCAAQCLQP